MHLYLVVHPDRALTVRPFAAACATEGHAMHSTTTDDPRVPATMVLLMPPDNLQHGLHAAGVLWRQLPPTTERMGLVAPIPLQTLCDYLHDDADDCQPRTRNPREILAAARRLRAGGCLSQCIWNGRWEAAMHGLIGIARSLAAANARLRTAPSMLEVR